MIITKIVTIKLNSNNIQYYKAKGYAIPSYIDTRKRNRDFKRGSTLEVKVYDLPLNSNVRVEAKCITCGETRKIVYAAHTKNCYYCNLSKFKGRDHGKYNADNPVLDDSRLYSGYLMRKYGIDLISYIEILQKQNNKCAICARNQANDGRKFAVDHDHKTGKIRGILCQSCNTGIGLLGDSISGIEKAFIYLKEGVT